MADDKKIAHAEATHAEAHAERKPEPKVVAKLAPAGESGDPAVHQLIAELDVARQNDDDDRVKELVGKLADLGFAG